MEELIFFAVIIIFSIIESISRSRKAKRERDDGAALPDRTSREPWEADEPGVATYDTEPSYDDLPTEPSPPLPSRREGPDGPRVGAPRSPAPSSEAMLPGDLLEELMGLAGRRTGSEPATRRPAPSPSQRTPEPWAGARSPAPRPGRAVRTQPRLSPDRVPAPHRVHLSHHDYATDPSERAPSLEGRIDPLRERHNPDAAAVHRQLRSHSKSALRRAIILQEVLGPPVSLREERHRY